MASTSKSSIFELLSPVLEGEGIEFVDVELLGEGKGQTVRFLIHKPGGITVKDCQHVSRVVHPILEVHGLIENDVALEVASPGLDRPLVTEADFRRNVGRGVQIETVSSTGKSLRLSGTVTDVEAGKILLDRPSGETIQLEISTITKAQIQLMW
jgi:ribosome maturation factor RimP